MRILIEVPTYDGRIAQATWQSLWRLDRCGHSVDCKPRTGYGCDMARNRIAADALNGRYDFVMMVDNDIALPQDALANLLEHGADFAMGYYLNRYARGEKRLVNAYKLDEPGWRMYEAAELLALRDDGVSTVAVKAGGLGCALIRSSVFERIEFPWFKWEDIDREDVLELDVYKAADKFYSGGEDVGFCKKLRGAGVDLLLDTRVACGHEFREVVWPK